MDTLEEFFKETAEFLNKNHQVQRMYDTIWEERSQIYAKIIVGLKKSQTFSVFGPEISRLNMLNLRERKILTIISENSNKILTEKNKLSTYLKTKTIEKKQLSQIIQMNSIEALSEAVKTYLDNAMKIQETFLNHEKEFIASPERKTLKKTYCYMKYLVEQVENIRNTYSIETASHTNLLNIQTSFNKLFTAIVRGELELTNSDEKENKLKKIISMCKAKLSPYFNKNDRQLYGTFAQRVSLNTTDFGKIVTSIGIRMALIAPLLIEATTAMIGSRPSMKIILFKNYPQFYLDIYLFLISYTAYVIDVIPGLAKYSIEGPRKLFAVVQEKVTGELTLDLSC